MSRKHEHQPEPDAPEPDVAEVKPQADESPEADAFTGEHIEELQRKATERDEAHERLLRAAADFENRRKRIEREADNRVRYATQDMLTDLLPVFDDLARATEAARSTPGGEALVEGVQIIEKHLCGALAKHGVHPIESLGEKFDPNRHDALTVMPRDDVPEGTVVDEIQRGWLLNDRVILAARVIVSAAPPQPAETDDEN